MDKEVLVMSLLQVMVVMVMVVLEDKMDIQDLAHLLAEEDFLEEVEEDRKMILQQQAHMEEEE